MLQQRPNRKVWVETVLWPWPAFPVGVIVLLVGSFLYVWLRVEPRLEYHSYGPYFFRQRAFLEPFLSRPGGLASYAGVFLAQFNCLNWLGALVFVMSECVVLLGALFCLARIGGRPPGFVAVVPLFVLLLLRGRFSCPLPAVSIGLFLALAASAAYILLPWRRPWFLAAVSGLICSLLFWLSGLWSALLFAVLGCLLVFIPRRNWAAGLGCLVLALAGPLLAIGAGNLRMAGLVNPWGEGVDWALVAALYASVPLAGAVLVLLPKPATSAPVPKPGDCAQITRRGLAVVVLAFLFGWAAIWLTFDRDRKLLTEIDYDANCGQYEAVLAAARQAKALSDPAKVRVQWALYHTGRLAEDLFSIHSLIEEGLSGKTGEGCRARSQPLFELGLVNDAEHMACEALVMEGPRPDLLGLLARINLVKDRPRAAQVFLNVLSLIPFQGERANDAWPAMDVQMTTAERAKLAPMHAPGLTNDVLHDGLPVGRLLEVLLASHPTNRMAFEYLMADYLLNLDLKGAVEHLRLLDNFDYARIPRPYEEALLLFQELAGVKVELKGRTIRSETAERFRQFKAAASEWGGQAKGPAVMAARFGDSYWFYYATRSRERSLENQTSAP
jgi:hypothetical protein